MHCNRAVRQAFAKVCQATALVGQEFLEFALIDVCCCVQARRYALRDRLNEGWRSASALAGVEKVCQRRRLGFDFAQTLTEMLSSWEASRAYSLKFPRWCAGTFKQDGA